MNEIENVKQEMIDHVEQAKRHIEKALNIVECNDNYNDGQYDEVNDLYNKIGKIYDMFDDI